MSEQELDALAWDLIRGKDVDDELSALSQEELGKLARRTQ